MKITEIRIERTKSLGRYEPLKIEYTASLDDISDSPANATDKLLMLADWFINKIDRDARYAKLKALEEPSDAEAKWLATYDARAAEISKLT